MRALLLPAACLAATIPSAALAGPAQCAVEVAGEPAWSGRCQAIFDGSDGFGIVPIDGDFPRESSSLSLTIGAADAREIVALRRGALVRWGPARRAARNRNCWTGADFSICVYPDAPPMTPPLPPRDPD